MTGISDLNKAKIHRQIDVDTLVESGRYSGATYLSGYLLEISIKISLLKKYDCSSLEKLESILKSKGLMPQNSSLYTDDFEFLLKLTGRFEMMMQNPQCFSKFRSVNKWKISWRYDSRYFRLKDAQAFINSVKNYSSVG